MGRSSTRTRPAGFEALRDQGILDEYVIEQSGPKGFSPWRPQPLQADCHKVDMEGIEIQKSNILLIGPTDRAKPPCPDPGQDPEVPFTIADATT